MIDMSAPFVELVNLGAISCFELNSASQSLSLKAFAITRVSPVVAVLGVATP